MNKLLKNIFGKKFKTADTYKIKKIKVALRDVTNEKLKLILAHPKEERSPEEIAQLKEYCLNKSKFSERLGKDHIDETTGEMLLIMSVPSATYQKIKKKDEIIYLPGRRGEYFYIVMEGTLTAYNVKQIRTEKTGEEYLKLILEYRNNHEKYLLEKTIEENNINFSIDLLDIPIIEKIVLKIFLTYKTKGIINKSNPNYLEKLLEDLEIKKSDFNIEFYSEQIERKNNEIIDFNNKLSEEEKIEKSKNLLIYDDSEALNVCKQNENKILSQLTNITKEQCDNYYFFTRTEPSPITYFQYVEYRQLEPLDYFGETYNKLYIQKVITTQPNVELLCFNNDIYIEYITHEKSKRVGNQVDFLTDNFFFNTIYKISFDKLYFRHFEYVKYSVGQKIMVENSPISQIFFIKSGNVKLISNRSIMENHILIDLINNLFKKSGFKSGGNDIKEIYGGLYPLVEKGNFEKLRKEISIKKEIHLMSYQEKQCIGYECFYYGLNCLYDAVVTSDKVEGYKISTEKLSEIFNDKNKRAFHDFQRQSEKTMKILLGRIIKMNNMQVFIYSGKNKVEKENYLTFDFDKKNRLKSKKEDNKEDNIIISNNTNVNSINKTISNQNNLSDNNMIEVENIRKSPKKEKLIKKIWSSITKTNTLHSAFNFKGKYGIFGQKNNSISDIHLNNNQNINFRYNSANNIIPKKKKNYNLNYYVKIFDYKENQIKERQKELSRENNGLLIISAHEKRTLSSLKKESKTYQDFYKLSLGENRKFLKNKSDLGYFCGGENIPNAKRYSAMSGSRYKAKKFFCSLNKNNFSEFYPFNNKNDGYKKFKYDMSKSLLTNKKIFEYSILNNNKNNKNQSSDELFQKQLNNIMKDTLYNRNVYDRYSLGYEKEIKKKKLNIINFQKLYP